MIFEVNRSSKLSSTLRTSATELLRALEYELIVDEDLSTDTTDTSSDAGSPVPLKTTHHSTTRGIWELVSSHEIMYGASHGMMEFDRVIRTQGR